MRGLETAGANAPSGAPTVIAGRNQAAFKRQILARFLVFHHSRRYKRATAAK